MASTNKTENLGLSQWVETDPLSREDLNADFRKIDGAAAYLPVKLIDHTVEEETQSITFDVSEKNLDQFGEIIFYANFKQLKDMRINGVDTKLYYTSTGSGGSSVMEYLLMQPGLSRLSITKSCFVYHTNNTFVYFHMDRTKFPSLDSLEIFGSASNVFSVGDRISIWGIKR